MTHLARGPLVKTSGIFCDKQYEASACAVQLRQIWGPKRLSAKSAKNSPDTYADRNWHFPLGLSRSFEQGSESSGKSPQDIGIASSHNLQGDPYAHNRDDQMEGGLGAEQRNILEESLNAMTR